MASALRNKLNPIKGGPGGMFGASDEEVQALSQKAERPIAPTDPMETAAIGGNPDQAKMAGTPNQAQSALRLSLQQSNNLADVNRRQAPAQQSGAEAQSATRAQKLENLSGTQGRVQALTNQLLKTSEQNTQQTAQMAVDSSKLAGVAPESQQEASDLLAKLGSNQASPQDILRINQLLGKTQAGQELTPDQLKTQFLTTGQQVGKTLAQATADTIQVGQLDLPSLGFADENELAATLGVDPQDLQGMNLTELQEQSRKLFEKEYSKVQGLSQQAADPNLGPAERAEARKALKDAGATGVRKVEDSIDGLADQIANADEVKFAGQNVSVDSLLKDDYLSGLAGRYLDSDPSDPFREELKQTEPELAKWFDDNAGVLGEAAKNLDQDAKAFSEMQLANQNVGKIPDLPEIPADTLKTLFPDFGTLRADAYDTSSMPGLNMLKDQTIPASTRSNVRSALDTFAQSAPQAAPELLKLSPEQLAQLGATGGPSDQKWQAVTSFLNDTKNINVVDPSNPDTFAQYVMGPGKTVPDLEKALNDARVRQNTGMFGSNPMDKYYNLLDANKDGKLDDPNQVAINLRDKFGKPVNVQDLVNTTPDSISKSAKDVVAYNQNGGEVFDSVAPYFQNKSFMNDADVQDMGSKSPNALEKAFVDPGLTGKMQAGTSVVQQAFEKGFIPQYDQEVSAAQGVPFSRYEQLANAKPGTLTTDELGQLSGTLSKMKADLTATNERTNPLKKAYLNWAVNKYQKAANRQMDAGISKLLEQVSLNPKSTRSGLQWLLRDEGVNRELRQRTMSALGIPAKDDPIDWLNRKLSSVKGGQDVARGLASLGVVDDAISRLISSNMGANSAFRAADSTQGKALTDALGKATAAPVTAAKKVLGK